MQNAVKAVAFQYESDQPVRPLLETFRMMVNHAIWIGTRKQIRGRFKLISAAYEEFKRYGLHTHYTLGACEVAAAILKNHRRNHRAPVARRLSLKLDNQTYRLQADRVRIPIKPREFVELKLKLGQYQQNLLGNASLKHGSITLTENKLIIALTKTQPTPPSRISGVIAYDTNELSLDGVVSNDHELRPVHVDLRSVAKVRADHFERRRHLQTRLSHCGRKLNAELVADRGHERRRVDAILHQVAKSQVNFAKEQEARIVLEDLKGIRRSINRRVRKRNPQNGKLQKMSAHSKTLKRRLNSWPFRRLQAFIAYKANWEGVPLVYVPAKNTSRICARCGCLQNGHEGVQDPKSRSVFQCPKCGRTCDRHLNAALNLLRTQDEGRWFSPDRRLNEVMTAKRAYGTEATSPSDEEVTEPPSNIRR